MIKFKAIQPEVYEAAAELLRPFIWQALVRTPQCKNVLSRELRMVEEGISTGAIIPVVLYDEQKVVGIMCLELHKGNLHIRTLAGKLPDGWEQPMLDLLVQVAKGQQRKVIRLRGRKGWKKFLKPWGFVPVGDYLQYEVT